MTYCLVPRDLAPELHELLRTHFADRDDVEVVVERRARDRRSRLPRRGPGVRPAEKDRRRVRAANGRRTGERRGELVAIEPLPLPPGARHLADRLTFVELIEPEPGAAEDTDTARLIVDFQSGNAEVFSILYMRYFDRVYNYVRLVVRDAHDGEDVTQQAFLRTLDGLETFEVRAGVPFVAWLLRVARNESLGHLRKHQRIEVEDPAELARRISESAVIHPDMVDEVIGDEELQQALSLLPESQRQALMLRYVFGLNAREAALVLDRTPQAVRHLEHRGLRFLEQRLGALGRGSKGMRREPCVARFKPAQVLRARRFALGSYSPGARAPLRAPARTSLSW